MKTPKEISDYAALLNLDIPAGREKLAEAIAAAVAEAVKAEREECANVCNSPEIFRESYQLDANTGKGYNLAMRDIAAAIRARNGAK